MKVAVRYHQSEGDGDVDRDGDAGDVNAIVAEGLSVSVKLIRFRLQR